MSLSIKILESNKEIERAINRSIAKEMNDRIKRRSASVRDKIKARIPKWIMQQPEIQSIRTGGLYSLKSQFGITSGNADAAVSAITNSVANSITVEIKAIDPKNLKGGIEFRIQPENFNNLLSLQEGFTTTKKGQNLHWMDWLLLKGTQMIIIGYRYEPSTQGRSGGGTMVGGSSWRVPPQFSGTQQDNFITRSLSGRDQEIENIFKEFVK